MKKLLLILLCFWFYTTVDAQSVSLNYKNVPLKDVLKEIQKQTGYKFIYNDSQIKSSTPVTVNVKSKSLTSVLDEILPPNSISYTISERQIVLRPQKFAPAPNTVSRQQAGSKTKIRGVVRDADQKVLPGAYVYLSTDKKVGAMSDENGAFILDLPANVQSGSKLVVSFIGMEPFEQVIDGRASYDMVLNADSKFMLDAVVVTGYQTISKERVTGSFSMVSSDVINSQIALNLASGLEGRIAGVVKNSSGDFTIRGASTMNAVASPLYVIDGFPVEGDSPEFRSSAGGTYLSYNPPKINPEDVESVTVLKDAAAASIYGSRAANGVIVVTTKKAKQGAAQVFFSADVTVKPVPNLEKKNYLSSSEFIDFEYDYVKRSPNLNNPAKVGAEIASLRNLLISPTMDLMLQVYEGKLTQGEADRMIDAYRSNGTPSIVKDFMDHIYRPTVNQRYYMSIGKAMDSNSFLGSITYNNYRGNVKNYDSNDLEVNLRNLLSAAKWLDVELNVNILSSNDRAHIFQPLGTGSESVAGALSSTGVARWPYARLVDDKGNPAIAPPYFSPSITDIIAKYPDELKDLDVVLQEEQDRNIQRTRSLRTRAAAKLNFKITSWLQFQTGFQYEASNQKINLLYNKESIGERLSYNDFSYISNGVMLHRLPYGDSFQSTHAATTNFTQRNQLTFNKSVSNGRHVVTAIAGTETREIKGVREMSRVWGYDSELLDYKSLNNADLGSGKASILGRGSVSKSASSFFNSMESLNRYVSLYGNASYTFNNRFDLSGSIRWDLSNLFGTNPKYQYRPFWSVGAGWNIHQEAFMSDVKWVNRLKLRGTYGINGNVAKTVSPYLIASYGLNPYSGQVYGTVQSPPNENLRWERTQSANIGVDFSLLKNRLMGSIDAYNKYSDDLLSSATVDPTYGFSSMTLNMGAILNRGVEVDLNGVVMQSKDLQWMAGFTFAYNYNKVDKLYMKQQQASDLYGSSATSPKFQEGYPLHAMYSYRFVRIDENGETVILNEKGEEVSLKNVSNINAVEYSGSFTPLYTGAVYSTLTYKGVALSLNFVYNAGHVMRKQISGPNLGRPTGIMTGDYSSSWQQPGDELRPGVTPRITYSYDSNVTNRNTHWRYNSSQVVSASYIKLRSITLSYNMSNLLKGSFLKNLTVRGQVDNLFYLAANGEKSDPEAYNLNMGVRDTPTMPTYYLGLNLSF